MNNELYAFIYPESKNTGKESERISIGKGGSDIPGGIHRILSKVRKRLGISEKMISTEVLSKMGKHLYDINFGEEITRAEIVAQAFHQFLEHFGADEAVSTSLEGLVGMKMAVALDLHYLNRTAYIADKPNAKPEDRPAVRYWGLVNYMLCSAYYIRRPRKYYFMTGKKERVKKRESGMHQCLPPSFKPIEHLMVTSASNMIVETKIQCTHLSKTVLHVIALLACIQLREHGYSVVKAPGSSGDTGGAGPTKKRKAGAL